MTFAPPTVRMPLFSLVTGLLGCLLFFTFLHHRADYLGHFAAGYGGTLGLATLMFMAARGRLGPSQLHRMAFVVALGSVSLGAFLEATVFNIAQFDPVDFCNQSLGALLAILALLGSQPSTRLDPRALGASLALSLLFTIAGFYFAFS